MDGIGQCYICHKATPMLDEHHIIMQAAGGTDGPTVDLCPSCHSGIHRQALSLLSRNPKKKQYFFGAELERAKPLIQQIIIALRATRESDKLQGRSLVTFETDKQFLLILHMLKADAGFTNLGQFCNHVLRAYARSKI